MPPLRDSSQAEIAPVPAGIHHQPLSRTKETLVTEALVTEAEAALRELLDAAQSLASCIKTEQMFPNTDHGDHIDQYVKRISAVHRKWKAAKS